MCRFVTPWLLNGLIVGVIGCTSLDNTKFSREGALTIGQATSAPSESDRFAAALIAGSPFKETLKKVDAALRAGREPDAANYVGILNGGEEALLARLHLVRHAKSSIDLQTFIWTDDEVGHWLALELIEAAKRGVRVRLLADYMGIAKNAEALAFLTRAHPNLSVKVYRPTARTLERGHLETLVYALMNFKGANQRMHHKLLVVDNAVAITGGRNVENSYYDYATAMNFKDRDVMVVGPVSSEMAAIFDRFWTYRHTVPAENLRDVARAKPHPSELHHKPTLVQRLLQTVSARADRRKAVTHALIRPLRRARSVKFISDLPGKNGALFLEGGGRMTADVLDLLGGANEEVWIQSPYLVLGNPGMRYFRKLRRDKPDLAIHISTNSFGSTDNLLAYAGNVRLRDQYVRRLGLHIYEYKPRPKDLRRVLPTFDLLLREANRSGSPSEPFLCLHGKSFVVDRKIAFIGSFNLDPRSAHLNTEAGLVIGDEAIAEALLRDIQRDMSVMNSWIIAPRPSLPGLPAIQMFAREITNLGPVDIAPLDTTGAFELKADMQPVPRDHPEFYERFRDIGSFPGSDGLLSEKELKTRLLKFSTKSANSLL